ncbi:DUF3422 family protein [Kordiimonas marina]|uniref:DUF3422 family protein n=1 Tax=Kordiimonas marina TaxID=2872312 RepID=UPI001FF289C3|nr:DUF3422 domain-containing protein [Kordiimonas marina]MCJ9429578.1 DUF3422 domain-containing protein [Kordiimonas marina]
MDFSRLTDPQWFELNKELHGRPAFALKAPVRVSHFAYLSGEDGGARDRAHLEALCKAFDVEPPADGGRHFKADFGAFALKWERHTEFTTYTVVTPRGQAAPFEAMAADVLPADWMTDSPGRLLLALKIELVDADNVPDKEACFAGFRNRDMAGSLVSGGRSSAWSDFHIDDDGCLRVAVLNDDLTEGRAGRLVQRLIEIFTYGHMALMALPLARRVMAQSATIEAELEDTVAHLAASEAGEDAETHLDTLLELAARTEHLAAGSRFRFSAAKAYNALVLRRFEEIREDRMPAHQRLSNFFDRHLAPAMRTCEAASNRLSDLALRVDRAAGLLRTQVELGMQRQNGALLAAMNRRSQLQLRLQETVEGLSVVAISYYALGLVKIAFKALKTVSPFGVHIDPALATGVAAPFVIFGAFMMIRGIRKSVLTKPEEDEG